MTGRLALLGVMLGILPFAVDLPGASDSSRAGRTQVELAGGGGQFAIISRGCNGEVLDVTRNQLASGTLVVDQPLPRNFVIGVRAGCVHTTLRSLEHFNRPPDYQVRDTVRVERYSNPYVNPYVAYEGRTLGIGAGAIMVDRPLVIGEASTYDPHVTWHVRLGGEQGRVTLRWLEDVPFESEGHLSLAYDLRPLDRFDGGGFLSLAGPYDGAMLGLRGRVWFTPDAAVQIKAGLTGQHSEYGVSAGVTARLPRRRRAKGRLRRGAPRG